MAQRAFFIDDKMNSAQGIFILYSSNIPVNIPTMTNNGNIDHHFSVIDLINDSIIAYSYPPKVVVTLLV
jgi:hypothetical protein